MAKGYQDGLPIRREISLWENDDSWIWDLG